MITEKVADVSNWQPDQLPLGAMEADGIRGLICQVEVPYFDDHMHQGAEMGWDLGAYRWEHDRLNPITDAEQVLAIVARYPLKLGLWLDAETSDSGAPALFVGFHDSWLGTTLPVQKGGTYTSAGSWNACAKGFGHRRSNLWDATYGSSIVMPPGWDASDLSAWQYTSTELVAGLDLDVSVFYMNKITPPNNPPGDSEMFTVVDSFTHEKRLVDVYGAMYAFDPNGAPSSAPGAYQGGLNNHPEWNAGQGHPNGPVVGAAEWIEGQGIVAGVTRSGTLIITRDLNGAFHSYAMPGDARYAGSAKVAKAAVRKTRRQPRVHTDG